MTDVNVAAFDEFLQGWMIRQRNYLNDLLSAQQQPQELADSDRLNLLNRVLCHYGQYYEEKSKIAHQNILLLFSPPWFSSLEKSFLWVAGFKPGLTFHLVNKTLEDLSEDQRQRLSELKQEIKMKERELNDELAKVHESMAAPPVLDNVRSHGRVCLSRSFMAEEGTVSSSFKETLENLVTNADALRTETALRVVQILKPAQVLNFFVAVAELQLKVRSLGFDKDAQRENQG
ncbi:putative transcription factor TGA like domain-containing protein [Medicago truncatula]|uniref:Putative transcription factor TGA like domain-containing protein n=1 Tax=Medicago truncatula TaxID=3880 RepID=A0A072U085_MEDTR|nr:protein RESPONSE TO ABA AND SALT 1 [Medicago truncatula]KEH23189.1 transcription factor TGA5-like protein [Medicago truncatula]RHN46478.1 putative transcription factor TGA like domain-containing protein [Medicago truncatula]